MSDQATTRMKIEAQRQMCAAKGYPFFAPSEQSCGRCFHCKRDVYADMTIEQAGAELITGCRYCHYSYCD